MNPPATSTNQRGGNKGKRIYRNHHQTTNMNNAPTSSYKNSMENKSSNISTVRHVDRSCCNGINVILTLDDHSSAFFAELKHMWNMLKKSPPVVNLLHQHFNACNNPHEQTLRLIYNCQEFNNAKNKSLPLFIVEEFRSWSVRCRNRIAHLLTPQLKIDAFKVISRQNAVNLTRLCVEVYEMAEEREIFVEIIRCMIEKKKYKEACQSAMLLGLQDHFSIEDFLLPLILQDKLIGVDDFLAKSPKHQTDLVVFLDTVLGKLSVRDALASYCLNLKIPNVKWDKLHVKPLKKLLTRLVKVHKLTTDLTPNLNRRRNQGALQFLMHKRFIENSFSDEGFKEMIQEAVGNDIELQKELVFQFSIYGEFSEGCKWGEFYNLDKEYWPMSVRRYAEKPKEQRDVESDLNWDLNNSSVQTTNDVAVIEYHKLSLQFDDIHLIDSTSRFQSFLDTGLQDVELVGIDCEWKPSFGSQKNELALMQIATRKNVFILDIISIGSKVPQLWQELGKFLFNNCDIFKLGFGFTGDFAMIKHSLPGLNFSQKQVGFLDLLSLWKQLERNPKIVLPYEVQSGGPSLSTLVHHCLGNPLNKSDQFSNWEKRPLRESQLTYAALDAYCLIEVYDVLRECSENEGFAFDEVCYNLMTNEKMPKKKTKKFNKKKQSNNADGSSSDDVLIAQPPSPHPDPISASVLKIVCDTMLQGLGKKLRKCGIDTVILANNLDHMECVRYAHNEQRYILSAGIPFNKLYGYVPLGFCLRIISDNIDDQLREVLNYYKVIITKEHVFSRCQNCNSNKFTTISQSQMLAITKQQQQQTTSNNDYGIDEATGFSSDEDFDNYEPGAPVTASHYSVDKIDIGQTKQGAKIDVDSVPEEVLNKIEVFNVCECCGKIYWDGSHFERILAGSLKGIVH